MNENDYHLRYGLDHPGRGHGGRHGRGGGRRRMFEAGELRLVLLMLMQAQARHGYDLIREIEDRTGGHYAPSPGIIYPTLAMLEDLGHIESQPSSGGAKRLFGLTTAGDAHLGERRAEAEAAIARLDVVRAEISPVDAGPVRRAMLNLTAALDIRLAGSQDQQTLFAAASLIDDAARKIERL